MNKFISKVADFFRLTDKVLLSLCISASLLGSFMVLSATNYTGSARQFIVQIVCLFIGLFVLAFVSGFADYSIYTRFWPIVMGIALLLVGLTFVIGFAPEGTDDKAWLRLPFGMTFQPSELLKIAFIITFAKHVSVVEKKINKIKNIILLCMHGAFPVILIHFQGDDGTALVLAVIFIAMIFASGIKVRYFALAGGLIAAFMPLLWYVIFNNDQRNRFLTIFNPEADIYGSGWQQWRGRLAIANGGIFGQGYMKGDFVQANQIPEGHNDFIFASIGEELGLIGLIVVMALLTAICIRILFVGYFARDKQGVIICTGVFAMIAIQSILNIGMCLSWAPVIGITLPFFSAGGTSLVVTYIGIALVCNVYMHRQQNITYLREDYI